MEDIISDRVQAVFDLQDLIDPIGLIDQTGQIGPIIPTSPTPVQGLADQGEGAEVAVVVSPENLSASNT